jgi:CRP-like cAMP-binding protein
MVGLARPADAALFGALVQKIRSLGLDRDDELDALLGIVRGRRHAKRGEGIVGRSNTFPRRLTVLLAGTACLYNRREDGSRQIYTFQYPGDFCDLHSYVLPEPDEGLTVGALTDCSTAIIRSSELEATIERYPKLGRVLWCVSMLEAGIFRERLLMGRRPALERVAHLLCEQLARREALGTCSGLVPLTQIDLADAAGLSVVHINRVFHDLRKLGLLSETGRAIEVVDRKALRQVARFDGRYLDTPKLLSQWQLHIDEAPN